MPQLAVGRTANRHRWDHQRAHFAERRRVVLLDLRDTGRAAERACAPSRSRPADIQLPVTRMLRMAKACPGALVCIIDAGHELPVERPEELTEATDSFVTVAPTA